MKHIKLNTRNVAILSLFLLLLLGSCSSSNDSMGTDIPDNPKPSDVKVMDKAEIVDYSKYYFFGKSIYLQAGIAMPGMMMRPMMSNGLIV